VSALVGITKDQLLRLQSILNYGIKIIENLNRRDNINADLRQRGWLSVESRIKYRIGQIVYTALRHGLPKSLSSLLEFQKTPYSLRSQVNESLVLPRTSTKTGDRAFSVAGAKVFNAIPADIRLSGTKFKVNLKNHLLL
jgi:hypothetical protein